MKIRYCLMSLILFINCHLVFSQTMQIANVQACSGDTLIAEITNTPIDSIGAVTIYINYDTASVKYINMFNFNNQLNGVLYNDIKNLSGQSIGQIAITWVASSNGILLNAGVFAKIKFLAKNSDSFIQFHPNCEITNYMADIYNINYIGGSISIFHPVTIISQPSIFINTAQNAIISIATQNYCIKKWQKKINDNWIDLQNNAEYQCTDCDTLSLLSFNTITNGSMFRCKLSNVCNTLYSDSVVINNTGISETESPIKISPNPFKESISITSETAIDYVKIYQSDGKLIKFYKLAPNTNKLQINDLEILDKALYFVEISDFKVVSDKKNIFKMIKN